MARITIVSIWSLFFLLVHSCRQVSNRTDELSVIEMNSSAKAPVSRLFRQIDLVPLETCDSSLIGIAIKRIERKADRLYVLNHMNTRVNLLCFDTVGKFLFRIDRNGNGPQEYTYLGDFFIEPQREQLVLIAESGHFLYLDLDGNFIASRRIQRGYYARQTVAPEDAPFYWAFNDAQEYPLGIDLIQLDTATMEIAETFSSSDIFPNILSSPLATCGAQTLYYHLNDTIYDLGKEEKKPLYRVRIGKKQELCKQKLPSLIAKDPVGYVVQMGKWFQEGDFIMVTHIGATPSLLFLSAFKQDPLQNQKLQAQAFFAIYDKSTSQTYNSDNLKWDLLGLESIADVELIGCSEGVLYGWFRKPFSAAEKEKINASPHLPQDTKDKLLRHTEEDNPILFMLR